MATARALCQSSFLDATIKIDNWDVRLCWNRQATKRTGQKITLDRASDLETVMDRGLIEKISGLSEQHNKISDVKSIIF